MTSPDPASSPAQPERPDQPDQPDQTTAAPQAAQPDQGDRADRGDQASHASQASGASRTGGPELSKRPRPADDDGEVYDDRVYRSTGSMATGVLLLLLGAWLGGDALVRGDGRTPWLSLAGLLATVPVVVAFTLRPAVFAGADRLLVRNPFRTIVLPWASVDGARAGYSSEVLAGGSTYQLWAIPVSLRQRKRASRQQTRDAAEDVSGYTSARAKRPGTVSETDRAPSDQAIDDIREIAERQASRAGAQGAPVVRWAYEVLAPMAAGIVLLIVLAGTG
ncbi:hypothetical protein FHS42_001905 [Streptomyces zagrosensis]|uniref:Low molecular weight protein antigen 6 PH domain-containing protein n=2 Tax=Streptomyces zagrosensis TaxID=1042984 RepID=A0A7W9Q7Y6_9ACTN|nr:hypothetical protein [Streptomyces zagrosensis]